MDLLDDLVCDYLDEQDDADETDEVRRAAALLTIAAEDNAGATLATTFEALDDPARFPELLDTGAQHTESATTLLAPLATIALTAATTDNEAALAGLYLAVAVAISGDQERATEILQQALTWDPGSESSWIARLADLGAVQSAVLPLITALATRTDDDGH